MTVNKQAIVNHPNEVKVKNLPMPAQRSKKPVWQGPEADGITFSLLSRFLVCRERFRILTVEGLKANDGFNHRLEFGTMWHVCEESWAGHNDVASEGPAGVILADNLWKARLLDHCNQLADRFPLDRNKVWHWHEVVVRQFPIYVDFWRQHPDSVSRKPLLSEQTFNVPYLLPSGRTVKLRGKWDLVDLVKYDSDPQGKNGVWLGEHKTKGDVRPGQIQRQLRFDLQTGIYLVALHEKPSCDLPRTGHFINNGKEHPIRGVRYNVVRRPLSGGKGTIVQKKATKHHPAEGKKEYYNRVAAYIREQPEEYFFRWNVEVSAKDVERFRRECLDPILEQLCDWWDWIKAELADPWMNPNPGGTNKLHWRHPYGVWNVLDEGGSSDLDEYLDQGSLVGLKKVDDLFPELKE